MTGEQILIAFAAPVARYFVDVFLAKAGAAARIGQRDDIPLGGPERRVPAIAPAIFPGALRPAVDQVNERPFFAGVKAGGLQDPHLHGHAPFPFNRHRLKEAGTVDLLQQLFVRSQRHRIPCPAGGVTERTRRMIQEPRRWCRPAFCHPRLLKARRPCRFP